MVRENKVWREDEYYGRFDVEVEVALRPEKERLQKNMANAINRMLSLVYRE
ncbi:MAG: hypothetical protein HZA15_06175 [Nitrospirae bacterium]|nr:hypothetical protein [Nitrospirota bacterium]